MNKILTNVNFSDLGWSTLTGRLAASSPNNHQIVSLKHCKAGFISSNECALFHNCVSPCWYSLLYWCLYIRTWHWSKKRDDVFASNYQTPAEGSLKTNMNNFRSLPLSVVFVCILFFILFYFVVLFSFFCFTFEKKKRNYHQIIN